MLGIDPGRIMGNTERFASLFQRPGSSIEFSGVRRLFALFLSFISSSRHLFSIVCSLFSQNTGGGVFCVLYLLCFLMLPLLPLQQC